MAGYVFSDKRKGSLALSTSPSTASFVCDPKVAKGMTHDPIVETAVVCDIYCKWFDTNAISWTLRSIDIYNEAF